MLHTHGYVTSYASSADFTSSFKYFYSYQSSWRANFFHKFSLFHFCISGRFPGRVEFLYVMWAFCQSQYPCVFYCFGPLWPACPLDHYMCIALKASCLKSELKPVFWSCYCQSGLADGWWIGKSLGMAHSCGMMEGSENHSCTIMSVID